MTTVVLQRSSTYETGFGVFEGLFVKMFESPIHGLGVLSTS
jgi:hypothetical protein